MTLIAKNLADLKARLGDEARLLDGLPLNKVVAISQSDADDAISIKIFYGRMRKKAADNTRHNVWIYLFPPGKEGRSPELAFRCYEPDCKPIHFDTDNIGRVGEEPAEPFRGAVSRDKITALAKYYFLEKMVAHQIDELEFAMPLTANSSMPLRWCVENAMRLRARRQRLRVRMLRLCGRAGHRSVTATSVKTSRHDEAVAKPIR